jgi:exosortase/archaeosortase family protein
MAKKPIKKNVFGLVKKNWGLSQFFIRTAVFLAILIAAYLFVFLYFRHTDFFLRYLKIGEDYYFNFLSGLRKTDFLNSALFTVVIFIIWNRQAIAKMKPYLQNIKETIIFGGLALLTQIIHYAFKFWIRFNPGFNQLALTLIKYLVNILFVILLALAVYNLKFFKEQFNRFKKQLPVYALVLVGYFFLIQLFQKIWLFLGNMVAKSIYFLLSLTFKNVYFKMGVTSGPSVGAQNFVVGISDACSGIDSLLLFISIYVAIFALDFNRINKKRMLLLFIPGILGSVLYNILRVYLLMLVGIFINPEFAIDMFHTNIGWILFLLFFVVFWNFGSDWVYMKKKD